MRQMPTWSRFSCLRVLGCHFATSEAMAVSQMSTPLNCGHGNSILEVEMSSPSPKPGG